MKITYSIFVLLLLTIGGFAQQITQSVAAPDLTVIKNRWYLITKHNPQILPSYPVYGGDDPERWKSQIAENHPYRDYKRLPETSRTSVYEIRVKNSGRSAIQRIIWKYQFYEAGKSLPIAERLLYSFVKIKAGATKNLILPTSNLPFNTAEASETVHKSKRIEEKAIVLKIEYADGSIWRAK